ncbi:UDP-3-O-[3-hydroxymyristoyl] N-acetylglucosamine deacetylase [Rhodobacteraceae bacterium WD3A24]|nr:UDP-3-O-[3-hydroxymyristoyl] N-acetylglucosamine deacetylase [Rhodobacteraceae bacterium WD3A24]
MQRTLRSAARFSGAGLHSGEPATITVRPAPADHGVRFVRTDLGPGVDPAVPAHWTALAPGRLCTRVANDAGVSVSTIEHLMAALAGCGIHNALVEIDGPEVPILDGSAAPFARRFVACGTRECGAALRALRILRPVAVRGDDGATARLEPAESLEIHFRIEFSDRAIGTQEKRLEMANGTFLRELSDSRTFCRAADVERMRAGGLALGGTLENAVVVEGARVLSPGGLRHRDEAVRHKMLDALGDLALAGAPVLGLYSGHRAGHALTARLLEAVFDAPDSHEWITCGPEVMRHMPGTGIGAADLALSA